MKNSMKHDSLGLQTQKKPAYLMIMKILALTFVLMGFVSLGYMYYQTRLELKFLASPDGQSELARREVGQVVGALAKLAILPEEEPVIATITDHEALASQSAFYANSLNGDKLVVYPQAKQAFIFSPSRNKIVNVGPLLIDDTQIGENGEILSDEVRIEIRNGSSQAGKANALGEQLSTAYEFVTVTSVVNASNNAYEGLIVVDNSQGKFAAFAQTLAKELNGKVASMPDGERSSNAELIVIVGN